MKLNKKLMSSNEHHKCLLEDYRAGLEQCREELVGTRVRLERREGEGEGGTGGGEKSRLKSTEQELKMVKYIMPVVDTCTVVLSGYK